LITKNQTIQEILVHNQFLELVLERFDIHLNPEDCTLEYISKSNRLELDFLVEILNMFDSENPYELCYNLSSYPLTVILDYLQRTHAYYLGKRLFELEHTIQIIQQETTYDNNLSLPLARFFTAFKTGLWEHIELEENYLFPHIRFLMTCAKAVSHTKWLQRRLKNFSLQQFIADHDDNSEQQLIHIQTFIEQHIIPDDRLSPVQVFLKQVQGFEKDLRIHALVEDHVLIPEALRLEQQFMTF
jgi:regulator of cell morphogenesis and NO signaling